MPNICIGVNCNKQPVFNYPLFKGIGLFCGEHKLSGMVDVKRKMCKIENCTFVAFNKKKELCKLHNNMDMFNILDENDI